MELLWLHPSLRQSGGKRSEPALRGVRSPAYTLDIGRLSCQGLLNQIRDSLLVDLLATKIAGGVRKSHSICDLATGDGDLNLHGTIDSAGRSTSKCPTDP